MREGTRCAHCKAVVMQVAQALNVIRCDCTMQKRLSSGLQNSSYFLMKKAISANTDREKS